MNNEKLDNLMIRHKKMISIVGRGFEEGKTKEEINLTNIMIPIRQQAKEICLVVADFKCENCGCEENLELHHLITKRIGKKKLKDYMNYGRYITSRYYWSNCVILCTKHHLELHEDIKGIEEDRTQINKEYIEKLKKKYKK